MRQLVDLMRRTTKKRLLNQGRYAANCLLSDTSDNDDDKTDLTLDDVDVNNERPAVVELLSCNSSFSDCSLPCHELITCSPPTQLAKGLVKVNCLLLAFRHGVLSNKSELFYRWRQNRRNVTGAPDGVFCPKRCLQFSAVIAENVFNERGYLFIM